MATAVTIKDLHPNIRIETAKAGSNAIMTPLMSFFVESWLCRCGDGDMVISLLINLYFTKLFSTSNYLTNPEFPKSDIIK